MAIWEVSFDSDSFEYLDFVDTDHVFHQTPWMEWFRGEPIGQQWQEIEVAYVEDATKVKGDFPSLGGIPIVFTQKALNVLGPIIEGCVEILPLRCGTGNLYVINVIKIIDCLDHNLSHFKRFSSGRIMRVEMYVFKPDCVDNTPIFKIPEQIRNRHYVTDIFKEAVEKHNLQGMVFTKVGEG